MILGFLDDGGSCLWIGDVGGDADGSGRVDGACGLIDLLRDGVDVSLAACGADYPGSGCCKGNAHGAADASSSAGDEDRFSLQAVDMAAWVDVRIGGVSSCES